MNKLQWELHYKENSQISISEIGKLAYELINTSWQIMHEGSQFTINLAQVGWSFGFNKHKRALGMTYPRQKMIRLSTSIFEMNDTASMQWEDTIRHEIAHALDIFVRQTSDHGPSWKNIAKQVLATPNATAPGMTMAHRKWKEHCASCGRHAYSHKAYEKAYCKDCCETYSNGKVDDRFILTYEPNLKEYKEIIIVENQLIKECGEENCAPGW